MTGEIINISPIKKEYDNHFEQQNDKNNRTPNFTKTYYDVQQESYKKTLKTKQEIEKLYKGDENGFIDHEKIAGLNYQLMCQGLWLSNINKGEYNKYSNIFN